MIDSDATEFARVVLASAELTDRQLSDGAIEMMFDMLSDVSIVDFKTAMRTHLREVGTFPNVAQIRQRLGAVSNPDDEAAMAWNTLQRLIEREGYTANLVLADARLGQAIERTFGSWSQACRLASPHDVNWNGIQRKQFMAEYKHAQPSHQPVLLLNEFATQNALLEPALRKRHEWLWFTMVTVDGTHALRLDTRDDGRPTVALDVLMQRTCGYLRSAPARALKPREEPDELPDADAQAQLNAAFQRKLADLIGHKSMETLDERRSPTDPIHSRGADTDQGQRAHRAAPEDREGHRD